MAPKTKSHIYDIYIFTTAGLPLYGGCTGSTFCQQHVDQHALHCGFFAAMTSFCEEAFAQRKIRMIEMENLKVHMLADPTAKVIIAGVYPVEITNRVSRRQLGAMINRFTQKYSGILPANIVNDKFFEDFSEDLFELKIIPSPKIRPSLVLQFEQGTQNVKMPALPRGHC